MTVKFGLTQKRINSTSVTMTATTELDVKLKNPCSSRSPVFLVKGLSKSVRYNYAYWRGAYYYVIDSVFITNDLCEVHCRIDPLGTYRGAINETYAYVKYSDRVHRNAYVDDARFGPDHNKTPQAYRTSVPLGFDITDWSVIMTVACATSIAQNGVLTYAMPYDTLSTVLNSFSSTVITDASGWTAGDFFEAIQNIFIKIILGGGQAMDNIYSLVAVPVPYSSIVGTTTTDIGMGAYRITLNSGSVKLIGPSTCRTGNSLIDLGNRPGRNTIYKWLNSPKYCSIQLGHPCGYQEVNDVCLLENIVGASIYWSVNDATGNYAIKITAGGGSKQDETIAEISGCVGIDIMSMVNHSGTIGGQIFKAEAEIVKAAFIGAPKVQAVDNYKVSTTENNGAYSSNKFSTPEIEGTRTTYNSQGSGIIGNFNVGHMSPSTGSVNIGAGAASAFLMDENFECYYNIEYYYPAIFEDGVQDYVDYCDEYGYPCEKYMKIGNNSGYIECVGASVGNGLGGIGGATPEEISTINSYLNSGLYIE